MVRTVGIDCGASLRKYAWQDDDGALVFRSTADTDEAEIHRQLSAYGATHARLVGIGQRPDIRFIGCVFGHGDRVQDELRLQAAGVQMLLARDGRSISSFVLVSIGTGTSYTAVAGDSIEKLPYGNALGGGFIAGMARSRGTSIGDVASLAAQAGGESLDVLYRDVLPQTVGSAEGEFVVAHFAKTDETKSDALFFSSVIRTVAVAVVRDMLLYQYRSTRPLSLSVVCIGTAVSHVPPLAVLLQSFLGATGFSPHLPKDGEFSAALGALRHAQRAFGQK